MTCRYCRILIELRGGGWSDREATTGLWFPGCSVSPAYYHEPAREATAR